MKVIVAGSREFQDYLFLKEQLDQYRKDNEITEIVSGMAKGPDKMALLYALDNKIPTAKFPADWDTYGKRAGPIRNEQMAKYADALVAFWDGVSKGTKNMIDNMTKLKKPVRIVWLLDAQRAWDNNKYNKL